jgi:hypothetical protein
MVTLAAFCNVFGIDLDEAASTELARCIMNTARIRAKHSEKPEGIRS